MNVFHIRRLYEQNEQLFQWFVSYMIKYLFILTTKEDRFKIKFGTTTSV